MPRARRSNLTTLHPIAAGDMYGIKGIDHLAKPGLLEEDAVRLLSVGPVELRAAADLEDDRRQFGRRLQCAVRHPVRHASRGGGEAARRADQGRARHFRRPAPPGLRDECRRPTSRSFPSSSSTARNGSISGRSCLDVSIIRATTADERGNLTYEHEGAYLGGLEQALAARNNGGIVIAQVKRVVENGTLKPHDVRVPGVLVDHIVVAPDQLQTTLTPYDPAISGEIFRPLSSFRVPEMNIQKVIARRVAMELADGMAVNIGFGISANVPRILLEEGQHGKVTWVIEQGRGRRRAAARLQVRLRLQRRGDHAFAASIHLFPGRRLRCFAAVLPADRSRRFGERLEALGQAACDGRRRRLRRHHGAREEDRVFRLLQCRRQAVAGRWRPAHRPGGQGQEGGRQGRAHLLLRQARRRAGTGHHLCHRALRHEADAGRAAGHRDRAGRRPAARRAGAGRHAACASRPTSRSRRRASITTRRSGFR